MATRLEAIIVADGAVPAGVNARTVRLTAELTMIPVGRDLLAQLDPGAVGDDPIPAGWVMNQPVAALTRKISAGRVALYVVSETDGGPGFTEAIAWRDGGVIFGPSGTCDLASDQVPGYRLTQTRDSALNAGLRAIGVRVAPGCYDEYETVGLVKHRMTGDWLNED